jgi:hypothetical protein
MSVEPAPRSAYTSASRKKPKPMHRYHQPQCFDSNRRTILLSASDALGRPQTLSLGGRQLTGNAFHARTALGASRTGALTLP